MSAQEWKPNRRQQALIAVMAVFPFPRITGAARDLQIPEGTARNWMLDPRFKDALATALDAAKQEGRDDLERRIYGLADSSITALISAFQAGDPATSLRAAAMVFERMLGKPRERLEHTGKDGLPIQHSHDVEMSGLTDAELRSIITRAGRGRIGPEDTGTPEPA